jgi:hypothetical protein
VSPERYDELSLAAQTAYSELVEAARVADVQRSIASLSGSFATKRVKERLYWYYQYRDIDGRLRQLYVGPDNDEVRPLTISAKEKPVRALEPLARSAIALGCERLLPKHFRIVRRLSEYGFFRAGGLLVGTHAFLSYSNMLGVHWREGARTQDVDLAHAGKRLAIALPATIQVDIQDALASLEAGFLPMASFDGQATATYLSQKDPELRLDFLTTRGRGGDRPYRHPDLNVVLQPLRFMEYLLEDPAQTVAFSEEGAVLVNVPQPARFALHKLIVWAEREASFRAKMGKDLWQAAALLEYFQARGPDELRDAWRDLQSRGKGWTSRAGRALKTLATEAPELNVSELLPAAARPRRKR